jgi:CYTH domain-containing protein
LKPLKFSNGILKTQKEYGKELALATLMLRVFILFIQSKKNIAPGINEEDEKVISSEEFNQFVEKCKVSQSKYISKERLIYPDGDLKWEVDVFNNGHHLIVAEIEVPSMEYEVQIPKFILDKLLMEVTGMKQFGNRNLSNKHVRKS